MKKNVFTIPMNVFSIERLQKKVHDAYVTQNGEEVLAMVRFGEVERICIALGASVFSEYEMMQAIHNIDPSIPILVLGSGHPGKIAENEYITENVGFFFETVNEFFSGDLTEDDYAFFNRF